MGCTVPTVTYIRCMSCISSLIWEDSVTSCGSSASPPGPSRDRFSKRATSLFWSTDPFENQMRHAHRQNFHTTPWEAHSWASGSRNSGSECHLPLRGDLNHRPSGGQQAGEGRPLLRGCHGQLLFPAACGWPGASKDLGSVLTEKRDPPVGDGGLDCSPLLVLELIPSRKMQEFAQILSKAALNLGAAMAV